MTLSFRRLSGGFLFSLLAATVFVCLLLSGCGDSGDDPVSPAGDDDDNMVDTTTVSFSDDIEPILNANSCRNPGCHGGGSASGGLSLTSYTSIIAGGVHGNTVVPGDSESSNLVLKLKSPPFGSRMPLGRAPLSNETVQTIADWIDEGAEDN